MALFRDIAERGNPDDIPLITTDGFEFYERVGLAGLRASLCLWSGPQDATEQSHREGGTEDGDWDRRAIGGKTTAIRRLLDAEHVVYRTAESNYRQGSAYLCRRTICHARWKQRLEGHLELLRCYYNFVRPHRALKFGRELRTPAMQAGLTRRRLTLREIFCSEILFPASFEIVLAFVYPATSFSIENEVPRAA
jgi:hypothetical protein